MPGSMGVKAIMTRDDAGVQRRPLGESLREYGRGVAGGLLFSIPLLYTMEVWWRGFTADPEILLAYLLLSYLLLLGYNRYGGMHRSADFREVAIESMEEMGLGLLISAAILFLLGRITMEMPLQEVLGKIIIEAMMVAIGVSVGTAQLGSGGKNQNGMDDQSDESGESGQEDQNTQKRQPHPWGQLVLGFCGAVLIASNVAPTEEIVMIGLEATPSKLLGLAVLSILLCTLILFYSGFVASEIHVRGDAPFWIAYGVVTSYGLALVASALMLWFFGRFQGQPFPVMVSQVVVLALPAALGASAGRLLIQ